MFVPPSDFLGIYGLDPAVFGGYEVSTQYNIQGMGSRLMLSLPAIARDQRSRVSIEPLD